MRYTVDELVGLIKFKLLPHIPEETLRRIAVHNNRDLLDSLVEEYRKSKLPSLLKPKNVY